jgi:hypothetical protein
MAAMDSSTPRIASGKYRIPAGGCIFGSDCIPGANIAVPVVVTVIVKGAGVPGVTLTAEDGPLQVASDGAPAQVMVTLTGFVPPVAESCML